jgi:hypothetical protein
MSNQPTLCNNPEQQRLKVRHVHLGVFLKTEDCEGGLSHILVNVVDGSSLVIMHISCICVNFVRDVYMWNMQHAVSTIWWEHILNVTHHVLNLSKVRACGCEMGLYNV